jgi:hypothetical protein
VNDWTQDERPLVRLRAAVLAALATAIVAVATIAVPGAQALTSNYCGISLSSGTRCWESGAAHTWAYNRATHPGGAAPSLCAYLATDTSLSVVASGSGCGTSVSSYAVCYGVSPTYWLAMVEHFASGSTYTIDGYANTAGCS